MPLADLSNAQQRPTRGKRFSLSNDVVPKGENVAPPSHLPSPKETPPRFLAPTKASAAKTNRAQPHSGRNTPVLQAQHSSKLARSGGAATITPPTSKWSASTADSVGLFDKSLQSSKSSPLLRVVTESEDCQSSSPSQSMPFIGRRTPATEKPLPARPVASLAYGPSPSKDSRTLIDAVERPLRLSIAGSQQDWPTLSPSPRFTPVLYQPTSSFDIDETQLTTPSARFPSTAATLLAAASELNRKMTGQNNDHHKESSNAVAGRSSSFPSSANVSDDAPFDKTESTTCDATHEDAHVSSPDHDTPSSYPTRTSSLRDRLSSGSLLECGPDSGNKVTGFTDFTRDVDLTSRPHSPSPASFSRPRPTSISHPSFVPTPTVVAASPVRTPRTASRIPMSDPKKATLVNIKSRRSSAIPLPQGDKGLSFGGRRINSPDPLKVLDHGIKRQQLKRANTNSSTSTSSTVPSKLLHNNVTPSIHRSKTSSPDGTMGSSTDDEEEVTTPSDKSLHFVKHGFKPKHVNRVSTGHCGGAILKVYDEAEVVLGRPPPSNSPFTGPLQTIPSQTALPVDGASPTCASFGDELQPRVVIKPTEFSAFAERLSLLQDSHKLASDDSIQGADLNDDTRSELVDLLREAEHEDALISQCGAIGLDVETREEIFRTLSVLEGRSGPPNTSVDIEQLPFMFGRLRSGFEKAPKSAAFVEDATLAERFLARQNSTASEAAQRIIQAKANGHVFAPATGGQESDAASQDSRSKTILSKWSDSTTSAKNSPGLKNDNAARQSFVTGWDGVSPGVLPKGEVSSRGSIGFPSRIPGVSAKAHRLLGGDERSISSQKTNVRRISSPTLGSTVPGSVKAAHKRVLNAAGSMSSRATMSSRSKNDQMPTPNTKPYSFSNELPRGRFSSAEVSSSKATRAVKTPRSRSKSRYVLDKLNGFFSNKRDRRNSEILPPVPSIKERPELDRQPTKKRDHATSLGSPVAKPSRLPPLTKMPTVSPPVNAAHPALSSTSLDTPTTTGSADYEGRRSLQTLSDKLIGRAQREGDPARKERLLNFAKVLNDSLISAREAQISAETAQTAARSAQLSYEMTMKSVAMLQRLASSMNRR